MKYFLVLLAFTYAVFAEDQIIEEDETNNDVDSAQFMMMPMGGCGNTCMCRQRCAMIWWMPCNCGPCNGCGCCNDSGNTPAPNEPEITTTTTEEATTTTTTTTESTTTTRNCDRSCCSGCSCRRPCTIWWMCPRPCAPTCCNNGCCNSNPTPPPPPPPECCSCPVCVPWTPCQPCRCLNNCCPGSNCCSGSGCSTTTSSTTTETTTVEDETGGEKDMDMGINNIIPPVNDEVKLETNWLDRVQERIDNRVSDQWNRVPDQWDRVPDQWERTPDRWDSRVPDRWDSRIPDRRDQWNDAPPRFPRDPVPNYDRIRDRRDPVYSPPSNDILRLEEWEIREILDRRDRRDQRY